MRFAQKQSLSGLCAVLSVWRKQRGSALPLLSPSHFARMWAPSSELCFPGDPRTRQNCLCGTDVVLPFDLASGAPSRATLAMTLV